MRRNEYISFFEVARTHWWFVGTREAVGDAVARSLTGVCNPRIADLGCGAGNVLESLEGSGWLLGLDCESAALEVCQQNTSACLVRGNVTALPFSDRSLDLVVATDVFEHVHDDGLAARECLRVLRDAGTLVATVPAIRALFGPHDRALDHYRRYSRSEFHSLLEHSGFVVQESTGLNFLLLPIVGLVRLVQRFFVREPSRYRIDYEAAGGGGRWNRLLLGVLRIERAWLRRSRFPIGLSLLVVASRRSSTSFTRPSG